MVAAVSSSKGIPEEEGRYAKEEDLYRQASAWSSWGELVAETHLHRCQVACLRERHAVLLGECIKSRDDSCRHKGRAKRMERDHQDLYVLFPFRPASRVFPVAMGTWARTTRPIVDMTRRVWNGRLQVDRRFAFSIFHTSSVRAVICSGGVSGHIIHRRRNMEVQRKWRILQFPGGAPFISSLRVLSSCRRWGLGNWGFPRDKFRGTRGVGCYSELKRSIFRSSSRHIGRHVDLAA